MRLEGDFLQIVKVTPASLFVGKACEYHDSPNDLEEEDWNTSVFVLTDFSIMVDSAFRFHRSVVREVVEVGKVIFVRVGTKASGYVSAVQVPVLKAIPLPALIIADGDTAEALRLVEWCNVPA